MSFADLTVAKQLVPCEPKTQQGGKSPLLCNSIAEPDQAKSSGLSAKHITACNFSLEHGVDIAG